MKIKITFNRVIGIIVLFLMLWGGKLVWQQFGNPANVDDALTEASFSILVLAGTRPRPGGASRVNFRGGVGDRSSTAWQKVTRSHDDE